MSVCSKCGKYIVGRKGQYCIECSSKFVSKKKKPNKLKNKSTINKTFNGDCSNCGKKSTKVKKSYPNIILCKQCRLEYKIACLSLQKSFGYNPFKFREKKNNETKKEYYTTYINSKPWFRLRDYINKRDNNKCVICDSRSNDVHHWKYNKELGTEDERLLTSVCRECHNSIHAKGNGFFGKNKEILPEDIEVIIFELKMDYFDK